MRRRRLQNLSIVQNTPNSKEANSEQQTVIGSSNVLETLDEPAEFQTESGGTRRGRGHTLLKDLYNLNPVERVKVSRNNHGQSVGSEARLLAGYLGIIARNTNMFPINYKSWHHMPNSNKNQALDNIKVSDDYIKKVLGKKWRDHKSTLKKEYFKKDIRVEEKLQNVPSGMLRTLSELEQAAAEAEEVSSGQKVGRLQLFEITHRKKDGSPMTSEAGEIMVYLLNNI
ncbi:DNA-directed RNA polymerase subunit beta'' [Gossypium arboreum]|uniref:DNA-directed RNA polymerase subunit beta n=1 Tax=Gossypium arboreum TaxID=29729 RepID=A0A0B0PYZ2_GOSAR|nr:DNA-directed RNA polymerase subunit beta'' [Gossypium arboreum]